MRELMVALMTAKAEKGQGLVEYGLIIVLVAVAVLLGLGALGTGLDTFFSGLLAQLGF